MAYEPSEIMFAAAMLFETEELKAAAADKKTLSKFITTARKKAETGVQFGNENIRKEFLKLMNDENIKDMAVGISAALGMKTKATSMERKYIPKVFMTGNVWPAQVEKFRVSAYGFADYNSADVMFTYDGARYYGVSLKKKPTVNASDPTVINKAFDSLMEGKQFDNIKEELYNARLNYFSGLVIEAVENGILNKTDILDFDKLTKTPQGRKELFEARKRNTKLFDKAYIDTKGYAGAKNGYKNENTNDPNSMRYFVNKKLSNTSNPLYAQFISVLNKHANLFAESLINVILKTNLYKEIEAKEIRNYKFKFYLVTGIGNITASSVVVSQPTMISLNNTLSTLADIEEEYGKTGYSIVLDNVKNETSESAKIFCKLKRGRITLLDLEIRYKGSFTSQPQFQGFLHPDFKHLLTKK